LTQSLHDLLNGHRYRQLVTTHPAIFICPLVRFPHALAA
jgi:hypothetical protein